MKKSTIVIGLVLLVAAVFFFFPDLLGRGGEDITTTIPPLSVVPSTETITIPTEQTCTTVNDCIEYAKTLDPNAQNIQATCTGTCNFIVEKFPTTEVTQ